MAIERAILENMQRSTSSGDINQFEAANELLVSLRRLVDEEGFIDYSQPDNEIMSNKHLFSFDRKSEIATLSLPDRQISVGGRLAELMNVLYNQVNQPVKYEEIEDALDIDKKAVSQLILRLRHQVEEDPQIPRLIGTVRGVGIALNLPKPENDEF